MDKKDGGWAFPVPNDANFNGEEGMSLRDYFAAKAMAAFISAPMSKFTHVNEIEAVIDAYIMADAMLSERAK